MIVYGFQNYYVSAFYVLGLFLLALHLSQRIVELLSIARI